MTIYNPKALADDLIRNGVADNETIRGCTPDEIKTLEETFNISLPESYKQFLSVMGNEAGSFIYDVDFTYKHLFQAKEIAEKILDRGRTRGRTNFSFTPSCFVFLTRLNEQFMFFDCSSNDDPPVFHFYEYDLEPKQVADTFSYWLTATIRDDIEMHHETKEIRSELGLL